MSRAIHATNPFVIVTHAGATQEDDQAWQAITAVRQRQRFQMLSQRRFINAPAAMVQELAIHTQPAATAPLGNLESLTYGLHGRSSLCRP